MIQFHSQFLIISWIQRNLRSLFSGGIFLMLIKYPANTPENFLEAKFINSSYLKIAK
jgi:hypothetical protein